MSTPRCLQKTCWWRREAADTSAVRRSCQCEWGRHKLFPADVFMDLRQNWAAASDPHQAHRRDHIHHRRPEAHAAIRYLVQLFFKWKLLSDAFQMCAREAIMVLFILTPFECPLTSVHTMNTAFAPSYMNIAKDGSTHSAASHPLTASAERQLLNTVIPERPVEVEAAGCARWLKPLWSADMWIVFHSLVSSERCLCPLDGTDERNIMLFCIGLPENRQHTSFQTSSFWPFRPFYFHQFHFFKIQYQCQCSKMFQMLIIIPQNAEN